MHIVIFKVEVNRIIPFAIFGTVIFICAAASFVLPETKNTPTMETLGKQVKISGSLVRKEGLNNVLSTSTNLQNLGQQS